MSCSGDIQVQILFWRSTCRDLHGKHLALARLATVKLDALLHDASCPVCSEPAKRLELLSLCCVVRDEEVLYFLHQVVTDLAERNHFRMVTRFGSHCNQAFVACGLALFGLFSLDYSD